MALIVASPQTEQERLKLIWADNSGVIQMIRPDGEVESEARTGSLVRDIAWPAEDSVYVLFENRQLKVIDPDSFAVKQTIEGYCSCIAVSEKGTLIGGQLRGKQIRSACFLDRSERHALAFADGHIEIVSASGTIVIPPENSGRGEWESFIVDDRERKQFVVAQTTLSDRAGLSEVSVRHINYNGAVVHKVLTRMASPAAIAASEIGSLIYDERGLVEIPTGKILKKAEGYPWTAMAAAGSKTVRVFGIGSANSLVFHDVT